MNIRPQKEFPLLEKFKEKFEIADTVCFAYDGTLYTNEPLNKHQLIHEQTHLKQQRRYGLNEFIEKYLTDSNFRLEMEIEAVKNELKSIKDKNQRNLIKIEYAKSLASEMYGKFITFNEVLKLL